MSESGKIAHLDKRRRSRAAVNMSRPEDFAASMTPGGDFMGVAPGDWREKADDWGLPPGCPVKPLGREGDRFFFLNVFGGVTMLQPKSGRGDVAALFSGAKYFPCWAWPKKGKRAGSEAIDFNFNFDLARDDLFEAASLKQQAHQMDMREAVRGRGCWPHSDGGLVVHLGNRVIMPDGTEVQPFAGDDHVYPQRRPIDWPAPEPGAAGADGAADRVLQKLRTWRWLRPDLDPYLMLGWIGCAFLGPAIHWRPVLFVVGDAGTGKSQLDKLVKACLQRWAILTSNATAPSLYREINGDSLAVIYDEAEGKRDNRRGKAVLDLAREAASGSMTMRAGGDGSECFVVRSAFMFSAINMPPAETADYSRMAILQLRPFDKPGRSPVDERDEAFAGAEMLRRLIDRYEFVVDCVNAFLEALQSKGHANRGADTFGVLAGVAWALLNDDLPDDEALDYWAGLLAPDQLIELEAATANWSLCVDQLLTAQPDVWRNQAGRPRSVIELLERWRNSHLTAGDDGVLDWTLSKVKDTLAQVGLTVVFKGGVHDVHNAWLFVPSSHPLTRTLFADTKWEGEPGTPGTWATALRGAPDNIVDRRVSGVRISGRPYTGVSINLAEILKEEGDERSDAG